MATGPLVTIHEYLSTSYRPDCDYVDGTFPERHLGDYDHARLQGAVLYCHFNRRKEWGIDVVPEQRVQVAATRFRVPDVCVIADAGQPEQIFRTPPLICIEILSKDDRLSEMQERVGRLSEVWRRSRSGFWIRRDARRGAALPMECMK